MKVRWTLELKIKNTGKEISLRYIHIIQHFLSKYLKNKKFFLRISLTNKYIALNAMKAEITITIPRRLLYFVAPLLFWMKPTSPSALRVGLNWPEPISIIPSCLL